MERNVFKPSGGFWRFTGCGLGGPLGDQGVSLEPRVDYNEVCCYQANAQLQQKQGSTVTLSKPLSVPEPQCQSQGVNLMEKILLRESWWGDTPLHKRLQQSLSCWSKNASPDVVKLLKEGIRPPWSTPPKMTLNHHKRGDKIWNKSQRYFKTTKVLEQ